MELILDTNFIIAMDREAKRKSPGAAHAFLSTHAADTFQITFTVAGELACGRSAAGPGEWQRLCRPFPVLPWTMDVSWNYGEIFRHLQDAGQLIGGNDLWIAATALVHALPVVTNKVSEFQRVPGLRVLPY